MKKGFTLIELLVVIAIIGILAALIMVSVAGARQKALDTQLKTNLRSVASALEQYAADQQEPSYPPANEVPIADGSTAVGCPASGSGVADTLGGCLDGYFSASSASKAYDYNGQTSAYMSCSADKAWAAGVALFSASDQSASVVDGANPLDIGECTGFSTLSSGKVFTVSGPN